MDITSFILGVCAVIVLMMVVGTSLNYMSTKKLKEEIDSLWQRAKDEEEARGQQHWDHINYADELYKNHEDNINELYKYVDSRVDKMTAAFRADISDINRQIAGKK